MFVGAIFVQLVMNSDPSSVIEMIVGEGLELGYVQQDCKRFVIEMMSIMSPIDTH